MVSFKCILDLKVATAEDLVSGSTWGRAADSNTSAAISLGRIKDSTNCGAYRVSRCTELQNCWLEGLLDVLTRISTQCRIVSNEWEGQLWLFHPSYEYIWRWKYHSLSHKLLWYHTTFFKGKNFSSACLNLLSCSLCPLFPPVITDSKRVCEAKEEHLTRWIGWARKKKTKPPLYLSVCHLIVKWHLHLLVPRASTEIAFFFGCGLSAAPILCEVSYRPCESCCYSIPCCKMKSESLKFSSRVLFY